MIWKRIAWAIGIAAFLIVSLGVDRLVPGDRWVYRIYAETGTSRTVTRAELRGDLHTASNTGVVTYTLPNAVAGMNACFYDLDTTAIITIDVDAGDVITLATAGGDDVALTAGDSIDSAGDKGDSICLIAIDTTNWLTFNMAGTWVDGDP